MSTDAKPPDPSPVDALLDRVTDRFKLDPELRLEIRHELRTHLEEAAAEHTEAGLDGPAAEQAALRSFGDEGAVADQLWAANRRRVRARRIAILAARFGIMPGAVAVALGTAWVAVTTLLVVLGVLSGMMGRNSALPQSQALVSGARERLRT